MKTIWWGATTQEGGTIFNSRANLRVSEGYDLGNTHQLINLGNFQVENFRADSFGSQTVDISAIAQHLTLKNQYTAFTREYKNGVLYYDDFANDDTLSLNYNTTSSEWAVNEATQELQITNPASATFATIRSQKETEDLIIISKMESTAWGNLGITFRVTDPAAATFTGYHLNIGGGAGPNNIVLQRASSGSFTNLATATATINDNTAYWVMIQARADRITCYISTDGVTYTQYISTSDTSEAAIWTGLVGLRSAAGTKVDKIHSFLIAEIGNKNTTDDIIKNVYAMGGVHNVNIENELWGADTFVSSAGTTWTNSGNGAFEILDSGASSNSWFTLFTSGATFSDFKLECEVMASNYAIGGLCFGNTNNFLGLYSNFGLSPGGVYIENYINSRSTYNTGNQFIHVDNGNWYKSKLIKNNDLVSWYINDTLAGVYIGSSIASLSSNRVGVMEYRKGASGLLQFRNFRISALDNEIDDVIIPTNTPLNTIVNRYTPEGYATLQHGITVEIFHVGASRANLGVTDGAVLQQASQALSNSGIAQMTAAIGPDYKATYRQTSGRIANLADYTENRNINDQNIGSVEQANTIATDNYPASSFDQNKQIITIGNDPRIELFDNIVYGESVLGVSDNFLITNFTKSFGAATNSFRTTLELSK